MGLPLIFTVLLGVCRQILKLSRFCCRREAVVAEPRKGKNPPLGEKIANFPGVKCIGSLEEHFIF